MDRDDAESLVEVIESVERPVMPEQASGPDPAPDIVTFDIVRNDPEVAALDERHLLVRREARPLGASPYQMGNAPKWHKSVTSTVQT